MAKKLFDDKSEPCPFCAEPIIKVKAASGPTGIDLGIVVYKVNGDTVTVAPDNYRADHRMICKVLVAAKRGAAVATSAPPVIPEKDPELERLREENRTLLGKVSELEDECTMLAGDPHE